MNFFLKAGCLAVYLLAIVGVFVELPFGATSAVQYLAIVLLGLHVLELFIAFKSVKLYPGPLLASIALTLLFGLLHWMPLAKTGADANKASRSN
ncbi:MAG: hypothetical protein WC073_07040 [Sterolibacterium sp.]